MTNRTLTDDKGISWMRVSKRRARSAYDAGHEVIISPVYMDPFGSWALAVHVCADFWSCAGAKFDAIVDRFAIFNCNSKCGKYAAYYVRTEVIK